MEYLLLIQCSKSVANHSCFQNLRAIKNPQNSLKKAFFHEKFLQFLPVTQEVASSSLVGPYLLEPIIYKVIGFCIFHQISWK